MEDEDLKNPSMREALEAAYDESEEPTEEGREDPSESVSAAPEEEEGRARDERGRFAPKEAAEAVHPEAKPDADAGRPAAPPDQRVAEGEGREPSPLDRAPQSWRPGAREAWAQVPPAVREEVYRREQGLQNVLNQTVEERKLAQGFRKVYAPYEAMIRGEGADPLQAVDSLFQTAYQLRSAPPQQKAKLVADLVKQFGVDIGMLDAAIVGDPSMGMDAQQYRQAQQPQQPMRDPRFDQLMQVMQQQRQQNADAEVMAFAQSHEFLDDVREEMADMIEVAAKRGVDLSLEDAYNRACKLNPEIAKVMEQRASAQRAGEQQQRSQRARRAASSVRGNPAGAPPSDKGPTSLRDAIMDAMDSTG